MIDRVEINAKANDPGRIESIFNNVVIDKTDGSEIHRPKKGTTPYLMGLRGDRMMIYGSIHKCFQLRKTGIKENAGFFSYSELQDELSYLAQEYDLDFSNSYINKVEFGFNLKPRTDAREILNSIQHFLGDNKHKYKMASKVFSGHLFQLEHVGDAGTYKIYEKRNDKKLDKPFRNTLGNIVRMEIRTGDTAIMGSKSLESFMELRNLRRITSELHSFINKLVIAEYPITNWYTKATAQRGLLSILYSMVKGREQEIWNHIESLPYDNEKRSSVRKSLEDVISNQVSHIGYPMLKEELKWALDREISKYFGDKFTKDVGDYINGYYD